MPFAPEQFLLPYLEPSYYLHTRIHKLNSYINTENANVYIKREDELSSGISGSKYRKFASLIKYFKDENFDEIAVIGSAHSNNVVAALQLLNENRIKANLFLLRGHQDKLTGNALWIKMLLNEDQVVFVSRENWADVEKLAMDYAAKALSQEERKVFVLNEGAAVKEAIPGAMTLSTDIIKNEAENNDKDFDHIFIDSGTGTSAVGLILGLQYLQRKNTNIYITLIAGDEDFFRNQLAKFSSEIESYLNKKLPEIQLELHFLKPATAASFGAINNTVLIETVKIAKQEGILMEPLYSVKHLYTAKEFIEKEKLKGNILIIYNGGSFGLTGFQESLGKMLSY